MENWWGVLPAGVSPPAPGAWPRMPKQDWGPRGWNWLHQLAINYPRRAPTREEARLAFRRIWTFVTHLPCEECRRHATAYVVKYPPNLRSTVELQSWAWEFHNAVNRRLGKPEMSYDDYLRTYAEEIHWANAHQ